MKKNFRIATILLAIVAALALVMPCAAFASETNKAETVRVGYVISPNFQEGADGEYKTGYGYEYLQKIASYAGWKYEYVYGTLSDLQDKLASGEIDLMGNVSYTEQRVQLFSYGTHEQGREAFYLFVNGNNSSIKKDDYSTLNGKKIGVGMGSYQATLWEEWCQKNGVTCQIVEFESRTEREAALNSGQIDATIGTISHSRSEETANWVGLFSFGDAPYFFCVSKSKPQLLDQLNEAQARILNDNPYYNEELVARYLPGGMMTGSQLSESEKAWLAAHNDTLKVGCLDNYLPISDQDEQGNMAGVLPDLLLAIQSNYHDEGLRFELVIYKDYSQMIKDVKNGTLDIAAPMYGDYWNAEKEGVSLTNSFLSTTMLMLFNNGNAGQEVKTIGVDKQSPSQAVYARIYYPSCAVVLYPSMAEVARAVTDGKVDAALSTACCYHVSAILDRNVGQLSRSTLPHKVDLSLAVARENTELLSLLNRGISTVDAATVNSSLAANSNVTAKVTLGAYIATNPVPVFVFCGGVVVLLLLVIAYLRRANLKARTDAMTGLLNKVAMREQVRSEISHGGVLFVIDVDDFKTINDTLGHEAGDQVISHFAEALQYIFRSGDLIGRFGGDEFTVFLPTSHPEDSLIDKKFEMMQDALANCDAIAGSNGAVKGTVSVGAFVVPPKSSVSYIDAFKKADAALYEAKQKGKATYVIAK